VYVLVVKVLLFSNSILERKGEYAMDTKEIMELSLKLAGLKEVPEDSAIYIAATTSEKFCSA